MKRRSVISTVLALFCLPAFMSFGLRAQEGGATESGGEAASGIWDVTPIEDFNPPFNATIPKRIAEQFKDPDLAAAVAEAMQRDIESSPTAEEYAGLRALDATHSWIAYLDGIEVLTGLEELNLRGNVLRTLPAGIGALTRLSKLDLGQNQLSALPPEIGKLKKLETLFLDENRLTQLPGEIGALSSLSDFFLVGNRLTALPDSMGNLSKLNMLFLPFNRLSAIPESMGKLTRLRGIDLSHNPLKYLPASAGNWDKRCIIKLRDDAGWQRINDSWVYQRFFHKDDTYEYYLVRGEWARIDGDWYYFGKDFLMHTGWLDEGGKWYYLKPSSGAMATGWFKVNSDWYFAEKSGAMRLGWLRYGGEWYYLKASGKMSTSWEKIDGKWYCFRKNGTMYHSGTFSIDGKNYRFDSKGVWLP